MQLKFVLEATSYNRSPQIWKVSKVCRSHPYFAYVNTTKDVLIFYLYSRKKKISKNLIIYCCFNSAVLFRSNFLITWYNLTLMVSLLTLLLGECCVILKGEERLSNYMLRAKKCARIHSFGTEGTEKFF